MNIDHFRAQGASVSVGQRLMTRIYMWMTSGLLVTAAVAFIASSDRVALTLFGNGMGLFLILAIAEIGIVFYLSSRAMSLAPQTAAILFFVYAALNGVTIAPLCYAYTQQSVASAFLTCAAMFGGMSAYGVFTKRDLSGWGSFLMMGVYGLIAALVINMFIGSMKADLVISIMGVLIFTGLTAFDTYRLRIVSHTMGDGGAEGNFAILGALTLYLDFINMFIYLLRIIGKRR